MRVLVVVHGFPPAAQGGSEIYAYEHARTLRQRHGDEVLVLTREQDHAREEYAVRREVRNELSIAWINNTFRQTRSFAETYRNAAIDGLADRLIDEFDPEVAHVHHLTCLSTNIVRSLARRGIPVVFTLHDFWLMCHRGQLLDVDRRVCDGPDGENGSPCHACLGPAGGLGSMGFAMASSFRGIERRLPSSRHLRRAMNRLAMVTASARSLEHEAAARVRHMKSVCGDVAIFLAPSHHIRERFIRFGVDPARIVLSPYGFDHRPFRRSRRTTAAHLRLGFLGSLMVSKAPHVLLEAAGRLPRGTATVDLFGAPCAYHGDDSYRETLGPLLAQDFVHVHGPVAHEQIPDALGSIDVLVVPSIWPENSPLVIQEAFLAGTPVVASNVGGIPEVITPGRNGLLFEPGDVEDLTRALKRLLDEPGLLHSLRAGLPSVKTIEDDVDSTRRVYEAERRRAASPRHRRRIAAVVLNYNTPDDTFLAVRSLLASKRRLDDVIVVDNGSTRDCRAMLGPDVVYVATGRNLGFSGGVNVGIRAALGRGADAVFLVNSDVIVAPDCIERLERAADRAPDIGVLGPIVLARSEPGRIASVGMSYDRRTGRMRHRDVGVRAESLQLEDQAAVDAVSGCSMLIKREVVDAIGLFDEDYFFTFEDLDFCLRARRGGFRTILASDARAYHEGSRSIGPDSPARLYFAARNHLLLASRNHAADSPAAALIRAASIVVLNLAHAVVSRSGSAPARFAAVLTGTRDYVGRRFGEASLRVRATR
jgi:GT2 family glycosyltransferase/glycosyltransferase involved in cell wall biosynthesis